jgi:TolA-binding protein
MQVGLNEAARLTGKDASTITRACQAGRLSFSKDESGNRMFDLAELERVYGPLRKPEEQTAPTANVAAITEALERAHAAEVTGLQREIRRLEDQVRLLETQCSQWQGQASQITRLLTDQREQAERDRMQQERGDLRRQQEPERGTLARRLKLVFGGKAA